MGGKAESVKERHVCFSVVVAVVAVSFFFIFLSWSVSLPRVPRERIHRYGFQCTGTGASRSTGMLCLVAAWAK